MRVFLATTPVEVLEVIAVATRVGARSFKVARVHGGHPLHTPTLRFAVNVVDATVHAGTVALISAGRILALVATSALRSVVAPLIANDLDFFSGKIGPPLRLRRSTTRQEKDRAERDSFCCREPHVVSIPAQ